MSTFQRLNNLEGQVVVITGGAGQVGMATAKRLAHLGARIVLLVRSKYEEAQKKILTLPNQQAQHFVIQASVIDSKSLLSAKDEIEKKAGRCDVLINAAGITKNISPKDLEMLSDEIFDEILICNLRGSFSTIRTFLPLLKKSGNGVVINLSSTASLRGSTSNVAYASAKAGINLLTKTLAKALAPEVRVLAVAPGHLQYPTSGAIKSDKSNENLAATSPLQRVGEADDVASTIEACITHMRFSTGAIIVVDGGRTI